MVRFYAAIESIENAKHRIYYLNIFHMKTFERQYQIPIIYTISLFLEVSKQIVEVTDMLIRQQDTM